MFAKSHEECWHRMWGPREAFGGGANAGGSAGGGPPGLEVDLNGALELSPVSPPAVPKPGRVDRRRLEQLRHAERRLRPLRRTHLASTYWRVYEEMNRVAWTLYREERARLGGSGSSDRTPEERG